MRHANRSLLQLFGSIMLLALAACAPAPIYTNVTNVTPAFPAEVARAPEHFAGVGVIWGGRIVQLTNLADHSEIEVLAYPLDSSQRPKANDLGNGRFIAVMPGYVESLDYPAGGLITISGKINGTVAGKVGDAGYVFPRINVDQGHVWTADQMNQGHNNVHFGLGVGVGIH